MVISYATRGPDEDDWSFHTEIRRDPASIIMEYENTPTEYAIISATEIDPRRAEEAIAATNI